MISRRGFIASAVVASATASLPAMAAPIPAPPLAVPPPGMLVPDVLGFNILRVKPDPTQIPRPKPLSPFEIARYYSGKDYRPDTPRPEIPLFTISHEPFRPEELQEFDSFRDLLFASLNVRTIPADYRLDHQLFRPSGSCCGDIFVDARIQINRQANLVAARTRRGAAQTVLYGGPNNAWGFAIDDLPKMWPAAQFTETSALNSDEMALIWHRHIKDTVDGPFVAQMLPGGRVRAIVREDSKNFGIILKAVE